MSFSVKLRYEGQFYKPGRLELTSLASLDAFVREFLRTRAVANADSAALALRYRDAAGDWQLLRDESDLVAATQQQDDSKIVVEVVVQPAAESVSDDAAIAAAVAAVDDDDDATTTDSTDSTTTTPTTATEDSDANKNAQCRAMRHKRGRRCVVFWLIVVGILLWCGFGSGCHKKRAAERAAAEQVSPAVRFLHIPPNFPAPDTQRFHDLAVLHFKQQQGLVVMSPADKHDLAQLASSAAIMFEENHRNALMFQQEVQAKVNEINRLSAVIANLQEHLAAHQQKESVLHVVVQRQAEELRQISAHTEQLQAQLTRASQQHQKQSAADAQTAPHSPDSLSNLFLDVSRKLGQLATNQMDELSQKHLGKPLEDLLDGSAVRKTLFDTLSALNNKLESHQQSTSQVIRQRMLREQQEREQQRRQEQELQQRREEQQRQEQLRQEQLRQEQLHQEQLQRQERQRVLVAQERQRQLEVQREHQRIRDHHRAQAERIEREHRESQAWRHKRTNQQLDDDDDAVSAKWHAKRLHERTKAAKRAMRELHNEL